MADVDENLMVGRIHLNGKKAPCIEILLDGCDGHADGDLILFRKIEEGRNQNGE